MKKKETRYTYYEQLTYRIKRNAEEAKELGKKACVKQVKTDDTLRQ